MLTFGSLFAGIGGLDLGLERVGMECKWQVEIDDYATRVLAKHWPNVRRWRDITTFPPDSNGNTIREQPGGCSWESGSDSVQPRHDGSEWDVDLICGGFPCQDISYAGKGAGLSGERSGLFYEAIRVVGLIRPRYVLLENVAALLSRGLDDVLGTLASIGFDAEWHCIPAAAIGAPHIRDRVFILATAVPNSIRTEREPGTGGRRIWEGDPQLGDAESVRLREGWQGGTAAPSEVRETTRFDMADTAREVEFGGSSWWEVEPDVGRMADGVPSWVDRLRGLGNAVVPQVAEWIGRRIIDVEESTERRDGNNLAPPKASQGSQG